jgi:hypothetical protein
MRDIPTKKAWTTERPTHPGWYWFRPDRHSQPSVRKIDEQLFVYNARIAECGILTRPPWIDEEQWEKAHRGITLDGEWGAQLEPPA